MGLITVSGVEIAIGANLDGLRAGVRESERLLKGVGKGVGGGFSEAAKDTRSWSDSIKSANQQLAYLGQNVGSVYRVGKAILDTALEFQDFGVSAQQARIALDGLVGSDAENWINAVNDAMDGAVSSGQAAAQAYTLAKFGFVESAEGAEEFLRTVRIMTAISPQIQTTDQYLAQLQLTLANTSFMRLDQLGLTVGEVKDRMKELQAQTAGLSREEAFNQAVMQKLGEQAAMTSDEIIKFTTNQDKLNAKLREFKEDVGEDVNVLLEDIAGGLLSLSEIGDKGILVTLKLKPEIAPESEWVPQAESEFLQAFDTMESVTVATNRLEIPLEPTITVGEYPFSELDDAYMQSVRGRSEMVQRGRGTFSGGVSDRFLPGVRTGQYATRVSDSAYWDRQSAAMEETAAAQAKVIRREEYYQTIMQRRASAVGYYQSQDEMGMGMQGDFAGALRDRGLPDLEGFADAAFGGAEGANALADSIERINEAAEGADFATLGEKFGITDPDTFGVSVMGEVDAMLKDLDVDATTAAEAMKILGLQTGTASAQSEIYNIQLTELTRQLNEGEVTAAQYVNAVNQLSSMDYSWVDKMLTPPEDAARMQEYLDIVNKIATLPETWGADLGQVPDQIGQMTPGAGDDEALNPFAQMEIDAEIASTNVLGYFEENDFSQPVETYATASTLAFGGFKHAALSDVREIGAEMQSTFAQTLTMQVTMATTGGTRSGAIAGSPAGVGMIGGVAGTEGGVVADSGAWVGAQPLQGGWTPPQFHGGGYTGAGSGEFMALLKQDEYVIPGDVVRGASGGGSSTAVSVGQIVLPASDNPARQVDQFFAELRRRGVDVEHLMRSNGR